MIKEQFSSDYHVVCNGTTNHPSVKGLLLKQQQKKKITENMDIVYIEKKKSLLVCINLGLRPGESPFKVSVDSTDRVQHFFCQEFITSE